MLEKKLEHPLNGKLSFFLICFNTFLLAYFIFGHRSVDYPENYTELMLIIPLQFGLVAYFSKGVQRKVFVFLTIVTLLFSLLFLAFWWYAEALGSAWQN